MQPLAWVYLPKHCDTLFILLNTCSFQHYFQDESINIGLDSYDELEKGIEKRGEVFLADRFELL